MASVLIIGGGYGGLRAVEHLIGHRDIQVTLIDKSPYHYLQTEAYGYIAGRFDLHDVAIDLKNWCYGFDKHVQFIHDEVTHIDTDVQSVTCIKGSYRYDYLVVATGAETNFFSFIEGLREHSFGVKKLTRAFDFRVAFEKLLYRKVEGLCEHEGKIINIAIGGAGLSGVEIAAEMADVIQKHTKSIGEAAREIRICLIDASETILPGMSDFVIRRTQERLESLGITIMTNAFIDKVEHSQIHLKDGRALEYHFMIFTGGIKVAQLPMSAECERNRIGQYVVDATMRIPGLQNVFAIGDCVEIRDTAGALLPPTAQTAEKSAEYVAEAIKKSMRQETTEPFNAKVDGVFVALGGQYAVGELFGFIRVKGYMAYLLKKMITKGYYFGLKLRVNTGFRKRTRQPR